MPTTSTFLLSLLAHSPWSPHNLNQNIGVDDQYDLQQQKAMQLTTGLVRKKPHYIFLSDNIDAPGLSSTDRAGLWLQTRTVLLGTMGGTLLCLGP